jgi:hypothetical protein
MVNCRGTGIRITIRASIAVVGGIRVRVFIVMVMVAFGARCSGRALAAALWHQTLIGFDFILIWHIAETSWWCHFGLWVRPVGAVAHHWLSLRIVLARLRGRGGVHGSGVVIVLSRTVRDALLDSSWRRGRRCGRHGACVAETSIDRERLAALGALHIGAAPLIGAALVSHAHDARGAGRRSREGMCPVDTRTSSGRMRLDGVRRLRHGSTDGIAH